MDSKILNRFSQDARKAIIKMEARLRELDEELVELDLLEQKLNKEEGLI